MINRSKIFQFSIAGVIIFQISQIIEQVLKPVTQWVPILSTKMHHKLPFFPAFQMNANTFMLISLILIVSIFIIGALIFLDMDWIKNVIYLFGLYAILGGLLPIIISLYFKRYFSGTISGVGLFLSGLLILLTRSAFHQPDNEE